MSEPPPHPSTGDPAPTGDDTGELPTSAQLDDLRADLDRVDAELARLDEEP